MEQSIEERLLTDDAFCEEFEVAEDQLIDQYLGNDLSPHDRTRFETCFLSTIERHEKFRLARTLNRYANTKSVVDSKPTKSELQIVRNQDTEPASRLSPRLAFWARRPAIAYIGFAILVLFLAAGVLIWRSYSRRSEIERGLLALNEAYREQRPGEARITGLAYAPPPSTRGNASDKFNYTARDRAERLLQDAANEQRSAPALHALGLLYLAKRQYEQAVEQLQAALKLSPNDAPLLSDLGAAFMERGNSELRDNDAAGGKGLSDFALSLEQLNHALEIDPKLLDALFNRALLYQSMKAPRQAADEWKHYLEIDPNSPWATEARHNLKLLEAQGNVRNNEQTLQEFLNAYRAHNDEQAWQVISTSREMITGRMIAFQLAHASLRTDAQSKRAETNELLAAMHYAGTLERARANDPFVGELSDFYSSAGHAAGSALLEAEAALEDGYRLCLVSKYDEARAQFERAQTLFASAGDQHEARLIDYWLAYCLGQRDELTESAARLADLVTFCQEHGYRWLLSQTLCQLANAYDLLGDHSRSLNLDRQALDIAVAMGDTYIQQKALTQLALQYTELGRPDHALDYNQRTLSVAASSASSPRQDWRNYTYVAQTLYALKSYAAAAAYEREALRLSLDELHDPALSHLSYTHLGMILAGTGHYDESIRQTTAGLDLARSLQNDSASRKMIAYSLLQLGHLTRRSGDCANALRRYDESLKLYEGMEISKLDGYDAHKGRLLCYITTGNDSGADAELPVVLKRFEEDRARIVEEQNRDSYFDAEQGVYDIAIDYAYRQGDQHRAFGYSEESRARSLLDMLTHGTGTTPSALAESDVTINGVATPEGLETLQGQLTSDLRVVQYAVLRDKLLIWVISRSSFELREQALSADVLNAQVTDYLSLLKRNDQSQAVELRSRAEALYDWMIAPIRPLLEGAKEVCIVPDKSLFHVPFAALVTPTTGRYLVEDFTLFFAPSTTVLALCSRNAKQLLLSHAETLLSVGNPAFDRASYPGLPDLPAAEFEAQQVAQIYGSTALTGARAQKATFLELLKRTDVVHFAGHYVADEHTPMRSRLLLAGNGKTDDSLTAAEVYGKPLSQIRLVVLSACQTELDRYDNGEGMIGIARTFLAAGAPLVVASQWPVDSGATAELMINFHRNRKLKGLNTAAALCDAQRTMITGGDEQYRSPYYWAAFLSVGGQTDY